MWFTLIIDYDVVIINYDLPILNPKASRRNLIDYNFLEIQSSSLILELINYKITEIDYNACQWKKFTKNMLKQNLMLSKCTQKQTIKQLCTMKTYKCKEMCTWEWM